jgi:hypothetical protein
MKAKSNITGIRRIKGGGWVGVSNPKNFIPRKRWEGLTPEEAYYKGIKDAESDRLLRELRKITIMSKR